ncbi:hypothetical protein JOM56_001885 [Amanita muscaria]
MRFAIFCLLSSLLVSALGLKSQQDHPPKPHGDFVQFQGTNGPHAGIIVGSHPDRQGNYNIIPTAPASHQQPGKIVVHNDRIVKAHASDIVRKPQYSSPHIASSIARGHRYKAPSVSQATGAVRGSSRYKAAEALAGLKESGGRKRQ